jgi:uncharacterized protein
MPKLGLNRILLIAIGSVSIGVVGGVGVVLFQGTRTHHLAFAAGSKSGESYVLGSALKKVVERHYSKIQITLVETGGTVENLEMLSRGQAQLAAAQADVLPGPEARIVAILYDDTFQLLVAKDSPAKSFADLRGRRIALAKNGGQYQSFLRVAGHYGLRQSDFQFVGSDDQDADQAFAIRRADAIFRVRALGNPAIERLVESGAVRFLPIEHAAAMKIKQPAFDPAVIPQGAYRGSPPVPAENLATVAVHRTLLAREDADQSAIRAITGVLIERRQELMEDIAPQMAEVRLLVAQVRRPEVQTGIGPPLHAGAASFFDKDKPTFLQTNADYIGLIVTLVLMVGSWIWELNRWMQNQQKNAADQYSNRVVALMSSTQEAISLDTLDEIWRDLLAILEEAVHDLDADKLSEESFNSFRSILQIAMDVTRDRRTILTSTGQGARASF